MANSWATEAMKVLTNDAAKRAVRIRKKYEAEIAAGERDPEAAKRMVQDRLRMALAKVCEKHHASLTGKGLFTWGDHDYNPIRLDAAKTPVVRTAEALLKRVVGLRDVERTSAEKQFDNIRRAIVLCGQTPAVVKMMQDFAQEGN